MKYKKGDMVRVKYKSVGSSFKSAEKEQKIVTGKSIKEVPLRVFAVLEDVYGLEYVINHEKALKHGDFTEDDIIGYWCEELSNTEDF